MTSRASRKFRILHSIATIGYGGVERAHLRLVEGLDPSRYEHAFVASGASGPVAEALRGQGVRLYDFGAITLRGIPGRTARIVEISRRWKPDVVHGAVIEGYIPGVIAGRITGARTIAEETSDPVDRRAGGDVLARIAGTLADSCVGISSSVAEYWRQRSIPEEKIRCIHYGVEVPRIATESERQRLRLELGIPQDGLVVGSVGRLYDDHKRFSDLIRVMPHLPKSVTLLIVGDGQDRRSLEKLSEDLAVRDRVVLAGAQDDVGPFYSIMDVFALASAREALGLVLCEAMFCCLPVVAADVGGIPDVVENGVTGLLVQPSRLKELRESIQILLDSPHRRERMGRAGLNRARSRFSATSYVRTMEGLYSELIDA